MLCENQIDIIIRSYNLTRKKVQPTGKKTNSSICDIENYLYQMLLLKVVLKICFNDE